MQASCLFKNQNKYPSFKKTKQKKKTKLESKEHCGTDPAALHSKKGQLSWRC